MRSMRLRALGFVAAIAAVAGAGAQVGHPVKGSWSGYWGTSAADKHRILLLLDWENRAIVGTINPGPNQVPIEKAELDVATWTLRLEATLPGEDGRKQPFVTVGQLTNLGSWTNRTYSGTYTLGAESGRFTVTLN